MEKAKNNRPYWHVDAKWVCGIIASLFLAGSLFALSLYQITSKAVAVPSMTLVVASMFSPNGIDDPGDIEKVKSDMKAGIPFKPIPSMDLTFTKEQIEGKSPREIRLMVFSTVVEPIYSGKMPAGITKEAAEKFNKDTTLLRAFSAKSHRIIGIITLVFSALTLIFLALAIRFSWGWGRLGTPAFLLILVSFLPATLFGLFFFIVQNPRNANLELAKSLRGQEGLSEILPTIFQVIAKTYLSALVVGIVLLIGSIIWRIRIKKRDF